MDSTNATERKPGVVIALGSNLGDSVALLRRAIRRLADWSAKPLVCSSLWRTSPVDCPEGAPPFVNGVVLLAPITGETPETMLARLKEMEREFGRRPKTVLNESRPLDLDLIVWGDEVRETEQLVLPHPRATQRQFVLRPLAEIAPGMRFPGRSETVMELLARLQTDEVLVRLDP